MKIYLFLPFAFFLLLLSACKDDEMMIPEEPNLPCTDVANPDCPNYDPCHAVTAADASFMILDSIEVSAAAFGNEFPYPGFSVEADTTWNFRDIYFKANQENATYEWLVGADPTVRTEKEFSLYFDEVALGDITVRLITTVTDTTGCLAAHELIDTSYQTIHFLNKHTERLTETGIFANYRGSLDSAPNDFFDIDIVPYAIEEYNYMKGLFNLPRDCSVGMAVRTTYRYLLIVNSVNQIDCDSPLGYGFVDESGQNITIIFTTQVYDVPNEQWEPRSDEVVFTGTRL